ncbi:SMI1/KNR4 family protein [Spirillospora sp. CA-253888]
MIRQSPVGLEVLRSAADTGALKLNGAGPASGAACRARETSLEPHFGTVAWTLPPSYRAFLAEHNRLSCVREVGDLHVEFVVVDEEEIVALNADLVHMPEHVSRDAGRYLSTNHLVGFAEAGGEAVWCFDVTRPNADGEYPVYYHHQDEPRARYVEGGAWEEPDDAEPDFVSFAAWVATMTAAFTATTPPSWMVELGSPAMVWQARQGVLRRAAT